MLLYVDPVIDEELSINAVGRYIQELDNEEITRLGTALGLNYAKLCRKSSNPNYYMEFIEAWRRQEDNVNKTSGEPSWESLAWGLGEIGQNGIKKRILNARALVVEQSRYKYRL